MKQLYSLSNKINKKDVDLDEICAIVECDTYSPKYMHRMFHGKPKVTACDILVEKKIDIDSRLFAMLSLNFLSDFMIMETVAGFAEQILDTLDLNKELKTLAEEGISKFHKIAKGENVNMEDLYTKIRKTYEELGRCKQAVIFEILLKPFIVELKQVPLCAAGCARSVFADNEEERLKLVQKQVNYLIELLQNNI
ncbi:MAG TPA: hypothetical protein VLL98_03415 [Rickettsiales bacterium]|nr:hypothetical protein [Rickettsiales bacterium]